MATKCSYTKLQYVHAVLHVYSTSLKTHYKSIMHKTDSQMKAYEYSNSTDQLWAKLS